MEDALVPAPAAIERATPTSRRTVLKAAAWSVPVVAAAVSMPLAAATVTNFDTDIRLTFGESTEGATQDITQQVVDFIVEQVAALGPQMPPGAPVEPQRSDFPSGLGGTIAYNAARAQWLFESGVWAAQNAEAIAQAVLWNLAVSQFRAFLERLAGLGELVFSARAVYPRTLVATNHGPATIPAGSVVTVLVDADSNLLRAHLPSGGEISVINTGGQSTLTVVVGSDVLPGQEIFSEPLVYNPAAVTLNLNGSTTPSSITASLLSGDTNPLGNAVGSSIGVILGVAPLGIDAISDEWEGILDDLESLQAIFELVRPLLPEIDWLSIISGLIPIAP